MGIKNMHPGTAFTMLTQHRYKPVPYIKEFIVRREETLMYGDNTTLDENSLFSEERKG
jgi:hypothetical protein